MRYAYHDLHGRQPHPPAAAVAFPGAIVRTAGSGRAMAEDMIADGAALLLGIEQNA